MNVLPVLIQSLGVAAVGVFSIGSITIVLLMLMSAGSLSNALGYVCGYAGGYMLIGVLVVMLGTAVTNRRALEQPRFLPYLLVLVGSLLVWLGLRNWRKPASGQRETPRFAAIVDGITPPRALALGAAVTVFNFKNLALFLTAVSIPLLSSLALPAKLTIVLLQALVFCSAVILPVLIYVLVPTRADPILQGVKRAIDAHSRAVSIWLPLIFGAMLLLRGMRDIP